MPTHVAFRTTRVPIAAVMGATVLAWTGFYVHNVADLPGQSVGSPETSYPTVVTIGCLAVLLVRATHVVGRWLMLGWTALNLLGGGLSVLPLPFLPFVPEQSVRHYAFHALYVLSQLPLLWLCICLVRPRRGVAVDACANRQKGEIPRSANLRPDGRRVQQVD